MKYTGDFHLADAHEKGDNGLRDFTLQVERVRGQNWETLYPDDVGFSEFSPIFVIFKSNWKHPYERTHLIQAYPGFADWIKLDPNDATTDEGRTAYQKVLDSIDRPSGNVIDHKWKGVKNPNDPAIKDSGITVNLAD